MEIGKPQRIVHVPEPVRAPRIVAPPERAPERTPVQVPQTAPVREPVPVGAPGGRL